MISFLRTYHLLLQMSAGNRLSRLRWFSVAGLLWFVCPILAVLGQASTTETATPQGKTVGKSKQSQVIQAWDFGRDEDPNKELRPYFFKRKVGREYPPYLPVQIAPRHPENAKDVEASRRALARCWIAYTLKRWPWEVVPETVPPAIDQLLERTLLDPCLEIQMDGGAVEMQAPIFPIESAFSYAFEIDIESQGLDGHNAFAELALLDANQKVVDRKPTRLIRGTTPWTHLRVGPIEIAQKGIVFGQVRIIVQPSQKIAIKGVVRADRIRVLRMPQLTVALNQPIPIYPVGAPIEVTCNASGLLNNVPNIELFLVDHDHREIKRSSVKIEQSEMIESVPQPKSRLTSIGKLGPKSKNRDEPSSGWQGQAKWKIPELPPGFYKLSCALSEAEGFTRDATFCILPKNAQNSGDKRFGWSMGRSTNVLPNRSIPTLLQQCCVRGFKIPIWLNPDDLRTAEEQSWLIERLKNLDIDLVGVLDLPPKEDTKFFTKSNELTLDMVWEQENIWRVLLIPVLSRSCLELSDFQIGWDNETVFTGNAALLERLSSFQSMLDLYGPNSTVHLPWQALEQPGPNALNRSRVLQHTVDPPWTSAELSEFIKYCKQSKQPFSINLKGIDLKESELGHTELMADQTIQDPGNLEYSLDDALQHLTSSMIAIIESGISKAWLGGIMDRKQGWLQEDGQPGVMLLPFRYLSHAFSEKEYLGNLPVPNDSKCQLLASHDSAVMLLSNLRNTQEQFSFGEKARAYDLFGRDIPITNIDGPFSQEQSIAVGPRPILVEGIDLEVAKWAMGIQIMNPILETTISGKQTLKIEFSNPTDSSLRGNIKLVAPEIFTGTTQGTSFKVDAMGKRTVDVDVTLRPDATSQKGRIRLDVEVQGKKNYRFSVYREIKVGQDDIQLEIHQQIDEQGNLLLLLEFLNQTGKTLRFDCLIELPNRPREKKQILDLQERAERLVGLRNASELVGETIWVRCQDMDSVRILNQRVVVRPQ